MHLLLNRWTLQLQTFQMFWLDQKRIFTMVYHRLKSSYFLEALPTQNFSVYSFQGNIKLYPTYKNAKLGDQFY